MDGSAVPGVEVETFAASVREGIQDVKVSRTAAPRRHIHAMALDGHLVLGHLTKRLRAVYLLTKYNSLREFPQTAPCSLILRSLISFLMLPCPLKKYKRNKPRSKGTFQGHFVTGVAYSESNSPVTELCSELWQSDVTKESSTPRRQWPKDTICIMNMMSHEKRLRNK